MELLNTFFSEIYNAYPLRWSPLASRLPHRFRLPLTRECHNRRKAVPRPSDSNNVSVKISPTEDDSSGDEKEDDNAQDDGSNHWFVKAEDDLHVDTVVAMSDGISQIAFAPLRIALT